MTSFHADALGARGVLVQTLPHPHAGPHPVSASAPSPASPTGLEADDTGLLDLALLRGHVRFALHACRRNKGLAALALAGVLALAAASLVFFPRFYRVQTVILALRNPFMPALANPGVLRPYESDAPTRAARETVLRRDNLVALIHQTGLLEKWRVQRAPAERVWDRVARLVRGRERTHDEEVDALVDVLEKRLIVDVAEGTVTITLEWPNRETAYQLTEAAMQNFLETRHTTEISIVGDAISILEAHARTLQRDIASTIAQMQVRYRAARRTKPGSAATEPSRSPPVMDQDLARAMSLLAAKRRAMANLEDFRQRRLAELQAQLVQYQTMYAESHPALISTRSNIESLSGPSPQLEALQNEARDLEREVIRLGGRTGGMGLDLAAPSSLAQAVPQLGDLRAEALDPKEEYDRSMLRLLFQDYASAQERIAAARVEMEASQAAFKYRYSVVSPPQLPKRPHKPRPELVAVGGIVGGLLFAVFAAVAADVRSGLLLERWQIERRLGLTVLAELSR